MQTIFCIKLGGSVITDKKIPYQANAQVIKDIAKELKKIKSPLLISHGAGSFAHTSAKLYGGMHGYEDKVGIAKVFFDAAKLNTIIMEVFLAEGLPVVAFSPRSFLLTKKGKLQKKFYDAIEMALQQGLIPVIHGDVIFDTAQKTTIFSGEKILSLLALHLQTKGYQIPQIIQLSEVDGVLDEQKKIIPEITKKNWKTIKKLMTKSSVVDVTGGMGHKIENALILTKKGIQTIIINGKKKALIKNALEGNSGKGTTVK